MTPLKHRQLSIAVVFACAAALAGQPVAFGQVTPSDPPSAAAPGPALSAEELENLVGPIALYPDDLVAIILPASTYRWISCRPTAFSTSAK
jgi:hypothetical protein